MVAIAIALLPCVASAQGGPPMRLGGPSESERSGVYSTTSLLRPYQWNIDGTVNAIVQSGNTIYFGGEFSTLTTHPGAGVPIDGNTGVVSTTFPIVGGINAVVYAAIGDGAGGWYIGGDFSTVGGLPRNRLAHVLEDGTVAPWNPGADFWVYALALQGDAVYIGGIFGTVGGLPRPYLAAVDKRTGAVLPWNPAPSGVVGALVVNGSTLFIGGGFTSLLGQPRNFIAAVDTRSGAATAWNPGAESYVACLAVHGNIVYAGGDFRSMGGIPRNFLAALDANTGAVTPWNPDVSNPPYDGFFGSDIVSTIAVTDAAVYVGGYFAAVGGKVRNSIAALDPSTGAALSWYPPLAAGYGPAYFPVVLAMGVYGSNVFIGGMFTAGDDNSSSNFVVVDAATAAPRNWSLDSDLGVTLIAPSEGRLYIGGTFRAFNQRRRCLAAIDVATGALTGWNPGFRGTRVNALVLRDSLLYVGGMFNAVGGRSRQGLAEIDARTGVATSFPGFTDGEVRALLLRGSRLYVAGSFTTLFALPYILSRNAIGAFDLDSPTRRGVLSSWDPEADGEVDALSFDNSTLYVGGRFAQIGGQPRTYLAALDSVNGEATSWNPSPDGPVKALVVGDARVYAGGEFHSIGEASKHGLAAIDPSTGFATSWSAGVDGRVDALIEENGKLFLGGAFQNAGGQPRRNIAALHAKTGLVLPWDPEANGDVKTLMATKSTVYAGGAFSSVDGQERTGLVAIKAPVGRLESGVAQLSFANVPVLTLLCAPSPVRSTAVIGFAIPSRDAVTLAIYDLAGRRVESLFDRQIMAAGTREVLVHTETWPSGCYFCRLTIGAASVTQKIVVMR